MLGNRAETTQLYFGKKTMDDDYYVCLDYIFSSCFTDELLPSFHTGPDRPSEGPVAAAARRGRPQDHRPDPQGGRQGGQGAAATGNNDDGN